MPDRVVPQDDGMEAISLFQTRRSAIADDPSEILEWLEVTPAIQ